MRGRVMRYGRYQMTLGEWLALLVIACTIVNVGVILNAIWTRRRTRNASDVRTENHLAVIADLTRRNYWQAEQVERLSRQVWEKERERKALEQAIGLQSPTDVKATAATAADVALAADDAASDNRVIGMDEAARDRADDVEWPERET